MNEYRNHSLLLSLVALILLLTVCPASGQELSEAQRRERCKNNERFILDYEQTLSEVDATLMTLDEQAPVVRQELEFVQLYPYHERDSKTEAAARYETLKRIGLKYGFDLESCRRNEPKGFGQCLKEMEEELRFLIERQKNDRPRRGELLRTKIGLEKQIAIHQNNLVALRCDEDITEDDKPLEQEKESSCNQSEQAVWSKMSGTWNASYGPVTFSGSCGKVTGHWKQGEWGEKGDKLRGEISGGRVSGGSLTFNYSQSWNNKSGSDSCYLSSDGKKLECSYLETLSR